MKKKSTFTILKIILFSFLFASVLVYGLNHFGKISFIYDYTSRARDDGKLSFEEYIPGNTKIKIFYFETYFKNKVEIDGGTWTASNVNNKSEFGKYSNKSEFYVKGTIADKKYILLIGLVLSFLIFIIVYYNEIKYFILSRKNNSNKTNIGYLGVMIALIVLFTTTYLDKKKYIDYNDDLTEQIGVLNNRISDLEDENDELKDKVATNEYDLKKSEIDREYYENSYNRNANYDDLYSLTQTVPNSIIQGTEYEQYVINRNSYHSQVEIKGKDNVINFLNYISRQYYLMYLNK